MTAALVLASLVVQTGLAGVGLNRREGPPTVAFDPARVTVRMPDGAKPDIYYILLDSHTSPAALRQYWRHDPGDWLARLRTRGFTVLEEARSNFAFTPYSVLCTLRMDYPPPTIGLERRYWHRHVRDAINRAPVVQVLRRLGYRFENLSPFAVADEPAFYTLGAFKAAERVGLTSLLRRTVLGFPAFNGLWPPPDELRDADRAAESERILTRLERDPEPAAAAGPRLVYAHVMLPHHPYVYGRDGRRRGSPGEEDALAYLDQLVYTDERVLQVVDAIRARSAVPPLIILQGDHGFRYLPEPHRAEEATCILNALLLPGEGAPAPPPRLTPVNSFRYLLRHYFGADLELIEDRVKRPGPRGV